MLSRLSVPSVLVSVLAEVVEVVRADEVVEEVRADEVLELEFANEEIVDGDVVIAESSFSPPRSWRPA